MSGPLKGFDNLVSAGGLDLDTRGLDAISGFGALEVVGDLLSSGWYDVSEGFGELRVVTGDLQLNNVGGRSAAAFSKLQTVGGSLRLQNFALPLSDFSQLTTIGGDLSLGSSLSVTALGFNALETIGQSLRVGTQRQLAQWSGLNSLRSIGDELVVVRNALLESAEVVEWSTTVEIGGMITICSNLGGGFEDPC